MTKRYWVVWSGLAAIVVAIASGAAGASYDPLRVETNGQAATIDLTVRDAKRGRDVPVRAYLPATNKSAPIILFSHGLGGSRYGSVFLGNHWAGRGYVAVFVQHRGSDDSVWRDKPVAERKDSMRAAASLQNFRARTDDVHAVIDALTAWNSEKKNSLYGRMDLQKIGMSGHSFGAITTQAVSGETFPLIGAKLTDSRIKAAIAFSPSAPRRGSVERAFGSIKIPWLLMTGTKDNAPIGAIDATSRLAVYPAVHGAPKYEVVLDNAEHSVFTDRALPGDHEPRNPNHHRVILAVSTAFWDAYLRNDAEALAWLNGLGPRTVMEEKDRWQYALR